MIRKFSRFKLLFMVLAVTNSVLSQDELPKDYKPPYSQPPKLELNFKDTFDIDSRADYDTGFNQQNITWEKQNLKLGHEATLRRQLNAGDWVEMELELKFPKLTKNGETSELKIGLDKQGQFDFFFVRFRQKRNQNKTTSTIRLMKSEGLNGDESRVQPDSQTLKLNTAFADGKWTIGYRKGLWSVRGPGFEQPFIGYVKEKLKSIDDLIVSTKNSHQLRSLQVQATAVPEVQIDPRVEVKEQEINGQIQTASRLYRKGSYKESARIMKLICEKEKKYFGKFHAKYMVSLHNLATLYQRANLIDEVLPLRIELLSIREKMFGKQHPDYADSLHALSAIYRLKGSLEQALTHAKAALKVRGQSIGKNHPKYAHSLFNLGAIYHSMRELEKAEPLFVESNKVWKKLGSNSREYMNSLIRMAEFYEGLELNEKALPFYIELLSIHKKLSGEKHPDYVQALESLATCYRSIGEYEKALTAYQEMLEIQEVSLGKEHADYADTLHKVAVIYQMTGAYEKAEPRFLAVLKIREKTLGKEHPEYGNTMNTLAAIYLSMNEFEKAEPLFLAFRDIALKTKGKEHGDYANSINSLGSLYLSMGRDEEALPLMIEARDITEKLFGKEHSEYARASHNLGAVYRSMRNYKKAEPLFVEAKRKWGATLGKLHPNYALGLHSLAGIYRKTGKYSKSESLLVEAHQIMEKKLGSTHPYLVDSLYDLAQVHFLMGEYEKAEIPSLRSVRLSRDNLDRYSMIQSDRRQREFAKSFERMFSLFVSNSLKMNSSGQKVWNESLQWKGISLVRQKRNLFLGNLPETRGLFANLKDIRGKLSRHLQGNPESEGWKKQTGELKGLEEEAQKKLAQRILSLKLDLAENVEHEFALPAGTCLVDFRKFDHSRPNKKRLGRLSDEKHYLALVRKPNRSVEMVDLGLAGNIDQLINRWRAPIENANKKGRAIAVAEQKAMDSAGRKLRKLLWDPLENHLDGSNLVIVSPDSALGRLPLTALPGKEPDTFLIEEKKIVYLPVPALLPQLLSKSADSIDRSSQALLVGDINYGSTPNISPENQLAFRNRQLLNELKFSPLQNSGKEVREIKSLLLNATALTLDRATEKEFQKNLKDKKILHIATHGFFQSPSQLLKNLGGGDKASIQAIKERATALADNPNLLSGLAFANANSAANKKIEQADNDGILYSAEIAMLPMEHVELAVLSACETSLGTDDNPGEGLIGIQRAFQVAGVKSTIASYWKVSDQATQMLMNRFYDNLIKYGKRARDSNQDPNSTTVRVDALIDAQRWMLRGLGKKELAQLSLRGVDDDTPVKDIKINRKPGANSKQTEFISHPRYWAAFVLSGDWR